MEKKIKIKKVLEKREELYKNKKRNSVADDEWLYYTPFVLFFVAKLKIASRFNQRDS